MSPEQARGRVDPRSDQFSAGAVFYELLTYRPAFDADDPMETLEKLRSEDPPSMVGIDASIPADLATTVERALRKEPGQRFPDLGQMRTKLEQVRRKLTDETERRQAHVRGLLEQVRELQRKLQATPGVTDDETVPVLDERVAGSDLTALERQLTQQIAALRARFERVEGAPPSPAPQAPQAPQAEVPPPPLTRADQLLAQGDPVGAIREFEQALKQRPDYRAAQEGLRRAREVERLLAEAKAAQGQGDHARCLQLLTQLAGVVAAAAASPPATQLRQAAETAQRGQAAAEQARGPMEVSRRAAEEADASHLAATLWNEAESKAADGDRALSQRAFGTAATRFQEA